MEDLEKRVAKLEGITEQISKRLDRIEVEISDLRKDLTARIDANSAKIDSTFRWTLGLLITMWVTIILTVLFG